MDHNIRKQFIFRVISSVLITEERVTMYIAFFLCLYHTDLKRNPTPLRSLTTLGVKHIALAKPEGEG